MSSRQPKTPKSNPAAEVNYQTLNFLAHGGELGWYLGVQHLTAGRPDDLFIPVVEVLPVVVLMKTGREVTPKNLAEAELEADAFLVNLFNQAPDKSSQQVVLELTAQHPVLPAWCKRFKVVALQGMNS